MSFCRCIFQHAGFAGEESLLCAEQVSSAPANSDAITTSTCQPQDRQKEQGMGKLLHAAFHACYIHKWLLTWRVYIPTGRGLPQSMNTIKNNGRYLLLTGSCMLGEWTVHTSETHVWNVITIRATTHATCIATSTQLLSPSRTTYVPGCMIYIKIMYKGGMGIRTECHTMITKCIIIIYHGMKGFPIPPC